MLKLDARGKKVLLIGDQHIPYSVSGYLLFLNRIKEEFQPDIIINMGDELDLHGVSFHDHDQDLFSAGHELDKAIDEIQEGLHKMFPRMLLLESNHSSLIFRRAKHHGLPIRSLRTMQELLGTPLWDWHNDILLETNLGPVYLCHGKSGSYGGLVKMMGASAVQGHHHGKFEITYHKTVLGTRFNMFVGCLVDEDSLAMAYGKNNIPKPILGSGGIKASGEPILFPYFVTDDTPPLDGLLLN